MGCDRICQLPDSLLTRILSYLPTKDSVTTSALSKRWEFLWLMVPGLDLRVSDFPHSAEVCKVFIDNFLEFDRTSRMQKFKIEYDEYDYYLEPLMEWIRTLVDHGIQHLDVDAYMAPCYEECMPQNIFKSNTLVSLKLVSVEITTPEFVVSLPCLKMMHLEDICHDADPLIMEKLISGCPVLEDFTLIWICGTCYRFILPFLRVRSQTLKRFHYVSEDSIDGSGFLVSVEIDAPRLEYLSFGDNQSDVIVVKNLSSLLMIEIDSDFYVENGSSLDPEDLSKRDIIRDFLTGISSVRRMIISQRTLEVLYLYSDLGPIPKFNNLYRFEAAFSSSVLQLLPVFLDSCPNLKNLILGFSVSTESEQVELSYVPQCLLSTLESVEIRKLIMKEETGIKLVNYFLENSAVLMKLNLSFLDSPMTSQELDVYKNLLTSTKRSRRCQVFLY